MKKILLLIQALLLTISLYASSGGGGGTSPSTPPNSCATSNGFCTGTTYTFPNNTNVASLGGGGIYGCLGSTPNPIWYYMEIATPGNLVLNISQTSGDVDFVMWGPFTSLAQGCSSLSSSNIVSCSYSTASNETATVNNTQTGQVYIVLLTNYANSPGSITFTQGNASASNAASTNCNVLCNMTAVTATPGACDPATGLYSVSGSITFQYPPTSGNLTVTSSCGGSVNIPAPWTSPVSYTLPGLTANGGSCSITASFTADAPCTKTQNYTAPAACSGCTITAGNNGPVCPGGSVSLNSTTVTGATSYSWTGPNGYTANVQNPPSFTAPTTPGSYTYTVTAIKNGNPCTSSTTVVVNGITVDAGADQTVCAGQSVTLNATGATTYTWDNSVTQGVAFTPTATGVYTVTGTTNGCTATDFLTITVTPLPVVSAGNDVVICLGDPVTLSGGGAVTLVWDNGVTDGVSFYPTATTTYTLTGTTNGCSSTDQVVVTVNPLPIADAGADQAVCAGQSVVLNGLGGTPVWDNGVTNGQSFVPSATTTYTLTVTDANQCVDTDDMIVTVNPNPVINAGNDVTVCEGTSVTLTATGGTAYTWDNNVTQGVAFTPSVGTMTYTVVDNNPNGCSGTDQVVVTVNPNPTVNAGNDTLICQGVSISLSGSGASTYTWDNGVVNGVPFTPAGTTTYTVTGTTAQGCTDTDQVQISITPTPVVSFVPSTTFGCTPVNVTFTNTSQSNNSFQWIFGNGSTSTGAGPVSTTYTGTGCFDVTLISTTTNGCVGQLTQSGIVCVAANPVASFYASPGTVSMVDSYTNMVNESTGATSYSWNFGDGSGTSNLFAPGHAFPDNVAGNYQITLIATSEFGCKDTAKVNIEVQDELIYYVPNSFTPDDDEYNPIFKPVFTAGFDPFDYKLLIFDRWGEVVFESNDALYGWNGTYAGSEGVCQDGVYTWKIEFKTTRTDERKMIIGHVTLIR